MPEIANGVFEALIPKAVGMGMSANAALGVFREMGYRRQTQAFFNLYRQARAAAAAVPELSLLRSNAYIPSNLMQQGGELQKFPYQYQVTYKTYANSVQGYDENILTIGSKRPLTKSSILTKAEELVASDEKYGTGVLLDLSLTGASVRSEI